MIGLNRYSAEPTMASPTAYMADMVGMTPSEYILRGERPRNVRGCEQSCKKYH